MSNTFYELIYNGLPLIGFFTLINLSLFFVRNKKAIVRINITSNIIFFILFIAIILFERIEEYPNIFFTDNVSKWASFFLYNSSNKMIGLAVYFA